MRDARYKLKSDAKNFLYDLWLLEGMITMIVTLFNGLLPILLISISVYLGPIIGVILLIPLNFGLSRRFVLLHRGEEPAIWELFYYYYHTDYLMIVMSLSLIVGLSIGLLSLLFVIPGLVAYTHFALYRYLLIDYPNLSTREILEQSSLMLKGYRIEILMLRLSFIGWNILGRLTIIGTVPLRMYKEATFTKFYNGIYDTYEGYDVVPEVSSNPSGNIKISTQTIKDQIRIV